MTNLPAKITAPLPAPTPCVTRSMSQQECAEHRAKIVFEVKVALAAYFDPSESDEVKTGLLAWFCDELQDWTHEQVVWALRGWNRENPRRRPTPGDLVGMLKKARGEKLAREKIAAPVPQHEGMTPERAAEVADELAAKFPGLGLVKPRMMPEVKA